jgi:alkyl sulfatase BDS1-like metallo-beta-lactamase superfamily hydrolase
MKFKINLVTPDNGEKFVMEMSNATLSTLPGYLAKDPDLAITINRSDLEEIMIGKAKLAGMVQAGKATMKGNPQVLQQLASTMTSFDPWFEVLPGTKKAPAKAEKIQQVFQDNAPVGAAAAEDE